jgi:hypothetical protein
MYVVASFSWFAGALSGLLGVALTVAGFVLNTRRESRKEKAENADRQEGRRDVARDEAIDLATVRGGAISDLQRELSALKELYQRERDEQMAKIADLQRAIELQQEQAFETLQMYAHGQRALFMTILGDLERDPPNVKRAVHRIRRVLSDPSPRFPGQSATT